MRRARIKATAVIPVRRKLVVKEEISLVDEVPGNIPDTSDVEKVEESKKIISDSQIEARLAELCALQHVEIEKVPFENKEIDNPPVIHISETSSQPEPIQEVPKTPPKITIPTVKIPESLPAKVPSEASSPPKSIQNRSGFVRPIPRLDGHGRIRRNSVQGSGASASESEDDARRITTNVPIQKKNDNLGTNQTDKQPTINNNVDNNTSIENGGVSGKRKRKMVISESARKLAEARREFLLKHEKTPPDRSKLTMYDLIYYNPRNNPMTKTTETNVNSLPEVELQDENEDVDDPEESAMPVPQVRVGPDGQLIIDEQSLVVKNTDIEKKKALQSQRVAVVEEAGKTGGFYKRKKKSKDWPKSDTIKFYKALSTVGTDFLLMQNFFPERSRYNIKMKYKKEERIHRALVEKALSCRRDYDVERLQKEFEAHDKEEKELEPVKKKSERVPKDKKVPGKKRKKRKGKSIVCSSIPEIDDDDDDDDEDDDCGEGNKKDNGENEENPKPRKAPKIQRPKRIRKSESLESDDDDDEGEEEEDSQIHQTKPTRSGRLPKPTRSVRLQNAKKKSRECRMILDEIYGGEDTNISEKYCGSKVSSQEIDKTASESLGENMMFVENIEKTIPALSEAEPGSLVICHKECPTEPGKTLLQVYMISSDVEGKKEAVPIDLPPNATIITKNPD